MKEYKIITENNTYIIKEEQNQIIIETPLSLFDFLIDIDNSINPRIDYIKTQDKEEEK